MRFEKRIRGGFAAQIREQALTLLAFIVVFPPAFSLVLVVHLNAPSLEIPVIALTAVATMALFARYLVERPHREALFWGAMFFCTLCAGLAIFHGWGTQVRATLNGLFLLYVLAAVAVSVFVVARPARRRSATPAASAAPGMHSISSDIAGHEIALTQAERKPTPEESQVLIHEHGMLGGVGAKLTARLLPVETCALSYHLASPARQWPCILAELAFHGHIIGVRDNGHAKEARGIVRAGFLGMNPAAVTLTLQSDPHGDTRVRIRAVAKEGLFKQHAAHQAAARIATRLSMLDTADKTGNSQHV